jgi:6-pyruvoyltetrahydropterin 2'-reductase
MKSPTGEIITGCDSIMAVNPSFSDEWTTYTQSIDLIRKIESCMIHEHSYDEKPDIIFTGGEPLIHHRDKVMIETIQYFISRNYNVWFETNGTINVDFEVYPIYKKVNFSISVKMKCSGENIDKRWKPETVNNYLQNTENSYFKFVYGVSGDGDEIMTFLEMIPTYAPVYIMPLGATIEQLNANAKVAYEYAFNNSFRYSDRLHIRVYDDLRMV